VTKRVNVVVKRGWILERMARELGPSVSINCGLEERQADRDPEVLNYYMPARDFLKYPPAGLSIGLYTHGPTGFELASGFVACVTMNRAMAAKLTQAARVVTIRPGTDPVARSVTFGVCGRMTGKGGRKGPELIKSAVKAGFFFVACSDSPAPCLVTHPIAERSAFYLSIDYLVVTSTNEGGPMPLLEAIAHGVPVIAPPTVGWCGEFPIIPYQAGSWPALCEVLVQLSKPPTWEAWRMEHQQLFDWL